MFIIAVLNLKINYLSSETIFYSNFFIILLLSYNLSKYKKLFFIIPNTLVYILIIIFLIVNDFHVNLISLLVVWIPTVICLQLFIYSCFKKKKTIKKKTTDKKSYRNMFTAAKASLTKNPQTLQLLSGGVSLLSVGVGLYGGFRDPGTLSFFTSSYYSVGLEPAYNNHKFLQESNNSLSYLNAIQKKSIMKLNAFSDSEKRAILAEFKDLTLSEHLGLSKDKEAIACFTPTKTYVREIDLHNGNLHLAIQNSNSIQTPGIKFVLSDFADGIFCIVDTQTLGNKIESNASMVEFLDPYSREQKLFQTEIKSIT